MKTFKTPTLILAKKTQKSDLNLLQINDIYGSDQMSVNNWSIKSSSVKRLSNHYQTGLEVWPRPQTLREKLKKMCLFLDFYEHDI